MVFLKKLPTMNSQLRVYIIVLLQYTIVHVSPLSSELMTLCNQTPNPKQCENILTMAGFSQQQQDKDPNLFKLAAGFALDRAINDLNKLISLGTTCENAAEKSAWSDCLILYDHTIYRLNQTLITTSSSTHFTRASSYQTWLSTALTNIDTCKSGFSELNATTRMPNLMSNSVVIELIKRALAFTKVILGDSDQSRAPVAGGDSGMAIWVRPGNRKLLQMASIASRADVIVAKDGSGSFRTVKDAITAAGKRGGRRYVIYVKMGVYNENIVIGRRLKNIMLMGDGIGKTVITGNRSVGGGGFTTFNSATVAVVGDRFMAQGITFENTAGPQNNQAVALRSDSDLSVYYNCSFNGYQDTLYVHSGRQFFKNCDIYGTVDFIFGNAAVVFQGCNIYARTPPNGINTVTAQGRSDPNQNTGISIQNCWITAAPDLKASQRSVQTYLGRPWKQYSRTVVMMSWLDSLISSAGWVEWSGNFALKTLYYGEYNNSGEGSSTANRVKWPGYHTITNGSDAIAFTSSSFISGDTWLPSTGVQFVSGL